MSTLKTFLNVELTIHQFFAPYGLIPQTEIYYSNVLAHNGRPRVSIYVNAERTNILTEESFDGLEIDFCPVSDTWNVFEYMAGENENELWEYKTTKYLKTALKEFLKGNKRKPIKIWT